MIRQRVRDFVHLLAFGPQSFSNAEAQREVICACRFHLICMHSKSKTQTFIPDVYTIDIFLFAPAQLVLEHL